jgi:hypothetical protein
MTKPGQIAEDLRSAIHASMPQLLALEAVAGERREGKWSRKEILGHLIDSAINNAGRIVRGQLQDELVFPGYAQNEWVSIGRYQDASWRDVVTLWELMNLQIARVIEGVREEVGRRPRQRHNFDEIGVGVEAGQPATLNALMASYVDHLNHHLRQILGA